MAHRAARILGFLPQNHPNIPVVHDTGQHDGMPYLVTELLEGETLRERLLSGPLAARKAVEFAGQIASGLAAAHEKGIVHRDLKPENVFLTRQGQAKILDFGLARLVGADPQVEDSPTRTRGTDPGSVLGSAGYMSPEQVRGQTADHRSDIFSFGVVLYETLTGERAFWFVIRPGCPSCSPSQGAIHDRYPAPRPRQPSRAGAPTAGSTSAGSMCRCVSRF